MNKKTIIIVAVTFFVLLAISVASVLAYFTFFANNEKKALEKAFQNISEAETIVGKYEMKTTIGSPKLFGESFTLNVGFDGDFAIDMKDKALEGDITFDIPFLSMYYDGPYSYEMKLIDNTIYTKDPESKYWSYYKLNEYMEDMPDLFDPELYDPNSETYKKFMKNSGYSDADLKKMNEMMYFGSNTNDLSYWKYEGEKKYNDKAVYTYKFDINTPEFKEYLDDYIDLALKELENDPAYEGMSFDVKIDELYYSLMVYKDSSEIADMKLNGDLTYMYEIDNSMYGYDQTMPSNFDIQLRDLEIDIVFESFNKDLNIDKPKDAIQGGGYFDEDDYINYDY